MCFQDFLEIYPWIFDNIIWKKKIHFDEHSNTNIFGFKVLSKILNWEGSWNYSSRFLRLGYNHCVKNNQYKFK